MIPVALTIAGSDPSGGAGIQADLKTFHRFGVYGEAALTLLTVQNTRRVSRIEVMPPDLVAEQIRAVMEDIRPTAAKTGALGNRAVVEIVAALAAGFDFPLVVDPAMVSKHGASLLAEDARAALADRLIPRATLVTPNLHEAAALTGRRISGLDEMHAAAIAIVAMGAKSALIKGGHLDGEPVDVLYDGNDCLEFPGERIETTSTHGTGCTYAAAITAELAKGTELIVAIQRAKSFVTEAIRTAPALGAGAGPVNHFANSFIQESRPHPSLPPRPRGSPSRPAR